MPPSFDNVRRGGFVLIGLAIVVTIVSPDARPGWRQLALPAVIALAAGLATGLVLRRRWTLSRRLEILHSLYPRLARRVLPRKDARED